MNPESGTISYLYDLNGNLTRKTDARGIQTNYSYDALNRVTLRDYSDVTPDVSYFYDNLPNAKGRLTKVSSSVSATEYTAFDILGRVTGHRQTTDGQVYTTAYTYNLSGALIEETYPSGRKVKNTLEADGDLAKVETLRTGGVWETRADSFAYNSAGAVTSLRLGNNRWESTVFNSRLQPVQIGLGTVQNGTNLLKLDYSYGTTTNNGNVLSQTITVPGLSQPFIQNYTYDSLNRLSSATETNNSSQTWKQTFMFDRYGNRNFDTANTTYPTSFAQPAITNPTVNQANNRFNSGQGWAYDASGNTTADANGQTFVYDAENKQIQVNGPGGVVGQYFYDGDGKRVKKVVPATNETTVFVYDAIGQLVAEYSTVFAPTPGVNYLTADHLGSPRIITDAAGAVTSRRDFHPFGEEVFSPQRTATLGYTPDNIRQKFTTYERDTETDLDFAQARYYRNILGRFYSPDPEGYGASEDDPQSWNGYGYGRSNPLLYSDPNGLEYLICDKEGKCWSHNDSDVKKSKKQEGFIWIGAKDENTGLDSGNIYDDDGNVVATYRQTSHDDPVQAMLWGAYPTLSIWQTPVELVQPAPIPGGSAAGGVVKGGSRVAKGAKAAKAAAKGFRVIERAGDVVHIAIKTAKGEVEVMANIVKEGDKLILKGVHVQGSGANSLGVRELLGLQKAFAQEIGKSEGVKTVVIEGAKRTSGANPGSIPSPRTFIIE